MTKLINVDFTISSKSNASYILEPIEVDPFKVKYTIFIVNSLGK